MTTVELVHAAGFTTVQLGRCRPRSVFQPVNEQLAGTARVGVS
jgi:hypothetical protein